MNNRGRGSFRGGRGRAPPWNKRPKLEPMEGENEDDSASITNFNNSSQPDNGNRQIQAQTFRQALPQRDSVGVVHARKRPFPKKERDPTFQKEPQKAANTVNPIRNNTPVFTSNKGCTLLGRILFRVIQSKNAKAVHYISEDLFLYVIHLCFVNRVVQTSVITGTGFPQGVQRLAMVCSSIELPDIICKFIESVGIVEMMNGTRVVPHIREDYTMYIEAPEFKDVMVPYASYSPHPFGEDSWCISSQSVLDYVEGIARAKPSSMVFRTVAGNNVCEGRKEMLVSYQPGLGSLITPETPEKMSESEARLGAIYHFRSLKQGKRWNVRDSRRILHPTFLTTELEWEVVFAKMTTDSFSLSR